MAGKIYSGRELSAFCLQISLLLKAAVPLEEGLSVMAEDASSKEEQEFLHSMSEDAELGEPFYQVLQKTGRFPDYVVRMAKLGQQSGTLDNMMESLSVYYKKEYFMMKNIRNAITYPIMMVVMLLVVLYVLFTRVIPVFEEVYAQLGVQMSLASLTAVRIGGMLSGVAALSVVLAVLATAAVAAVGAGHSLGWVKKIKEYFKGKSKTALTVAGRRFCAVLALTLQSGMELERGMEIAAELVDNGKVSGRIADCARKLQDGAGYYEALKETGLFSRFHVQMIKVGTRSGKLDEVMLDIAEDYEQQADAAIDNMVARLEPALVAVLAVAVGFILLTVMLPLAGVLAGIG